MAVDTSLPASSRDRWRLRLRSWGIELVPVVVVAFLALVALGHVVRTQWAGTFFYNGDSLALPLIEQSIQRGEPFHWVFTSQNFLFPEAPFFLISTIFTSSAKVALVVNACLNIVALYVLLRAVAHNLAHRSRHRFVEITIALGATLLFVVFVLLEPTASVNSTGIATLFLFTTYYYGVIIVGLAIIALTLWVTRAFGVLAWGMRRSVVFAAVVLVISGLATFSDPLFAFQVVAPIAGCLLILVFCNRLSWRGAGVLFGPVAVGAGLGYLFHTALGFLFASNVSGYLSLRQIPDSIKLLVATIKELLHSGQGTLKLLLLAAVLLVTVGILVYALYAQARPRLARRLATAEVFIVAFVSASAVSLVLGEVMTGSITTRYLEPLFVFPLLTVVAVGVYVLRRMLVEVKRAELRKNLSRFVLGIAGFASVLIVVAGIVNIAPIAKATQTAYGPETCLENFIGSAHINGVGSFWSVRPLQLYGDSDVNVLQIRTPIEAYAWMSNVGAFEGKTFSYVVQDASGQITPDALLSLGTPRQVIGCQGYQIYDYRDTPGERILTDKVAQSVKALLAG